MVRVAFSVQCCVVLCSFKKSDKGGNSTKLVLCKVGKGCKSGKNGKSDKSSKSG